MYEAAQCWMKGQSPYACNGFLYPLPTLFLFIPLTAFSLPVAKVLWGLAMLVAFVMTMKRRALWFMLFIPVLQAFWLGQMDILLLPAVALGNGTAIALLTLKPQLVWLYLPIWFYTADKKNRKHFLLTVSGLWGASLLVYPYWPLEFFHTTRPIVQAAFASPSLWGGALLPGITVLMLGMALLWKSRNKWAATTAVNPALIPYDLVILTPVARWWLVPLSWGTQWASNQLGMALPHVLLSIARAV